MLLLFRTFPQFRFRRRKARRTMSKPTDPTGLPPVTIPRRVVQPHQAKEPCPECGMVGGNMSCPVCGVTITAERRPFTLKREGQQSITDVAAFSANANGSHLTVG